MFCEQERKQNGRGSWIYRYNYLLFDKHFLFFMLICLAIILPQGVGVRFSERSFHVDLPRLAIIGIVVWSFLICSWRNIFKKNDFFVYLLVCIIGVWIVSGLFSNSPLSSILFSLRLVFIGPLFCLCVYLKLSLMDKSEEHKKIVFFWFVFAMFVLLSFAFVEFISQDYLIPNYIKKSFYDYEYYRKIISYNNKRFNGILVRGPYITNHNFGGVLSVMSGVVWWLFDKKKGFFSMMTLVLFFVSIYAVGSRAVIIAVIASLGIFMFVRFTWWNLLGMVLGILACTLIILCRLPPESAYKGLFLTNDLNKSMVSVTSKELAFDATESAQVLVKIFGGIFETTTIENLIENSGTIGIRVSGLLLNFSKINEWGLLGFGPGAFFTPQKVSSSAIAYDDPGLFVAVLFESGLLMGFLWMVLIARAIYRGFFSGDHDTWCLSIGLFSWCIFSLSSWAIWPMVPAMAFIAVIEVWCRRKCSCQGPLAYE